MPYFTVFNFMFCLHLTKKESAFSLQLKQWQMSAFACKLYLEIAIVLSCDSCMYVFNTVYNLIQHCVRHGMKLDSYPVLVDGTFIYGRLDLNVQR